MTYRERLRHEKILSSLAENITSSHTIYPCFGTAEFFEFVLKNPYSTDQNITIYCEDKELRYVKGSSVRLALLVQKIKNQPIRSSSGSENQESANKKQELILALITLGSMQ